MNSKSEIPQQPKDVNQLEILSLDVLEQIVREAEIMIESQYKSHLASEQRGFTFTGLTIAAATAAASAYFSKNADATSDQPISIAIIFSLGLLVAASFAIASVWPRKFAIPGSEPQNWLPDTWPKGKRRNLKQTRLEQAKILQSRINGNRKTAHMKARLQQASLTSAYLTTIFCAFWGYVLPVLCGWRT